VADQGQFNFITVLKIFRVDGDELQLLHALLVGVGKEARTQSQNFCARGEVSNDFNV
jgi:hypothetical protein